VSTELSMEQKATNYDTMVHIRNVQRLITKLVGMLLERGLQHDQCKMADPELETFIKYTPMLAKVTFGSPEYQQCLKEMQPALQHHFANSMHHPEHFKNGVNDMNLVDLLEMFVDWKAASMRHNDGNLRKSIEYNANKFGICPQLVKILENSIGLVE
jgi:hypothetical protein